MLLDSFTIPALGKIVSFPILLSFHILFSITLSSIAGLALKTRYKSNFINVFLFFTLFNFIFIVIGYVFSIALVAILYLLKYEKSLKNVKFINTTNQKEQFHKVSRFCGEGGLPTYINNKNIPHTLRMQALVSISKYKSKESVSFFRQSMISSDDEIRLFSFSIIDDFEKDLNGQIYRNLMLFNDNSQSDFQKAATAKSLAFLYWNMIYFDLNEEQLQEFSAEQAFLYAHHSLTLTLKIGKDPEQFHTLFALLGKIYFYRNELELAQEHFNIAIEKGSNADFIIPYLAEIHYMQKNYEAITKVFTRAKNLTINERMYPIIKQWVN